MDVIFICEINYIDRETNRRNPKTGVRAPKGAAPLFSGIIIIFMKHRD